MLGSRNKNIIKRKEGERENEKEKYPSNKSKYSLNHCTKMEKKGLLLKDTSSMRIKGNFLERKYSDWS